MNITNGTTTSGSPCSLDTRPETGRGSAEQSENWRERLQEQWSVALAKAQHLMPLMIGWKSIWQGMMVEDNLRRRDMEARHRALHGERAGEAPDIDETMGHIVLGDMRSEHNYPAAHQQKKSRLRGLFPLVAGLGLGAGAAALAAYLLQDHMPDVIVNPPPAPQPADPSDVETELGIRLGRHQTGDMTCPTST